MSWEPWTGSRTGSQTVLRDRQLLVNKQDKCSTFEMQQTPRSFLFFTVFRVLLSHFSDLRHRMMMMPKQKSAKCFNGEPKSQTVENQSEVCVCFGKHFPMILSSSSALLVHRRCVLGGSWWGWRRTRRWDSSGGETGATIPSVRGCTEVWDGLTAERDTCRPPPETSPPPTAGTSWTDCWAETRCTPPHNPLWRQRKRPWGSRLCSERRRHCSRRYLRGKKIWFDFTANYTN